MLYFSRGVAHFDVGEGMGTALVANEQGVTLGVVARILCFDAHAHQTPVGILAMSG